MKHINGWYFTDGETHFVNYLKSCGNVYQQQHRTIAINYCKNKRNVVDVGANIGLWSKEFCEKFEHVYSFEPVYETRQCLEKNLENFDNKTIYPFGLASKEEEVEIKILKGSSGHSTILDVINEKHVIKKEKIKNITLDSLQLKNIDLIKMDCQGYEYEVLLGAKKTLLDNDCALCVEACARTKNEIEVYNQIKEYLQSLGFEEKKRYMHETYWIKEGESS